MYQETKQLRNLITNIPYYSLDQIGVAVPKALHNYAYQDEVCRRVIKAMPPDSKGSVFGISDTKLPKRFHLLCIAGDVINGNFIFLIDMEIFMLEEALANHANCEIFKPIRSIYPIDLLTKPMFDYADNIYKDYLAKYRQYKADKNYVALKELSFLDMLHEGILNMGKSLTTKP